MKKHRHFPLEFKQSIVQEVESGLRSMVAVSREEKISCSLIDRWRKQVREGTLIDYPTAWERQLERELERYKKKVGELTLENDILIKMALQKKWWLDIALERTCTSGSDVLERLSRQRALVQDFW